MKTITAYDGTEFLVDDDDYANLSQFRWFTTLGYAVRSIPMVKNTKLRMHREVMGLSRDDPRLVDHIDGNKRNNQKSNLRIANKSQNSFNTGIKSTNTSGFKWVHWSKNARKWRAQLRDGQNRIHVGYFDTQEQAFEACQKFAREIHGEFVNFGNPAARTLEYIAEIEANKEQA
jgi:hypothetical protein